MSIKLPSEITYAGFVPVTTEFRDNLNSKSKFELYVNDQLALTAQLSEDAEISKISTRIRAIENPLIIKAQVTNIDGKVDTVSKEAVLFDNPYQISLLDNSNKKFKLKSKDGQLRMLYQNSMGKKQHIDNISFHTDKGKLNLNFTTLMSGEDGTTMDGKKLYGFLGINGNFSSIKLKELNLSKATHNQKSNQIANPASTIDMIKALKELDTLLENKMITMEEFNKLKSELSK